METSDSEYFESADEDFQSDEEDTKTVKSVAEKDENPNKKCVKELKSLKITETETVDNKKSGDSPKVENLPKDDENNISTNKPSEKVKVKEKPAPVATKEPPIREEAPPQDDNLWDDSEIHWESEPEKPQEENMWDNDDWEPMDEPPVDPEKTEPSTSGWGSWGTWGVSSILSTATQGVSTLTQGITTAIGVPEPEELARIDQDRRPEEATGTSFGLGNIANIVKLVETTGTRVISGGLDTLETIGKKTMEVLQEGDPGLKKKRAFLKIDQDKPVLSQLLREAKEKAETENRKLEEKHFAKKAKNYETLFDDHQGLVHLEALEMLSRQCDIKLQTLLESYSDESLTDMQETMEQVKELCELPDEDDDEQTNCNDIKDKLNAAVAEINIPISYKKVTDTWEETETWLNTLKLDVCDERELHQQAVETLAQLTAMAVEQFHKAGELLLVKEHRSTADEADSLVQLTTSLTTLIGVVAAKFSDKLNAKSSNARNKEEINGLITNVFFEAANSSSYIQDAFQLLIPVLQVGAV